MKTFQHYFIFSNLQFFSPIARYFQQFIFWFKEFCLFLFNNFKCFQHSTKQLNNLQNIIPAIFKCIYLVCVIITMQWYHILCIATKIYIKNLLESNWKEYVSIGCWMYVNSMHISLNVCISDNTEQKKNICNGFWAKKKFVRKINITERHFLLSKNNQNYF